MKFIRRWVRALRWAYNYEKGREAANRILAEQKLVADEEARKHWGESVRRAREWVAEGRPWPPTPENGGHAQIEP